MSMRIKIGVLSLTAILACSGEPEPRPAASAPVNARPSAPAPAGSRPVILFVGTSLTAGYGIGAEYAFPALIQARLDSAGLAYRVVNAGISGETSAGGLRRIDWALQQPVSVLVLELGANDALRGLDVDSMAANLDRIIERTRERYPEARIVIAGMEAPPNLGRLYGDRFRQAFRDVATAHEAALIPFILGGVAGRPELNQEDGIHPTIEGQRIMADTVWKYLLPVLRAPGDR